MHTYGNHLWPAHALRMQSSECSINIPHDIVFPPYTYRVVLRCNCAKDIANIGDLAISIWARAPKVVDELSQIDDI